MKQKRIALINDITGFGRCSVTVELPIISAMKIQVCPLPVALLSVHTGFPDYFMDDYTPKLPEYIKSWEMNGLEFDAVATGFFASETQIDIVEDFIKKFPSGVMIDPVMGDHGKIYKSYTKDMCIKMRNLLKYADLITPNLTEACNLAGIGYPAGGIISDSKLTNIAADLAEKTRGKRVIITGVSADFDDGTRIMNFVYDDGKIDIVNSEKLGNDRSGTGDVFFAVVAGSLMNGENLTDSVKKAASFVEKCFQYAEELNLPWNYGLPFEEFLTKLK